MEKGKHHIVKFDTNLWVWTALLVLTIITVAVAGFDLDKLTVVVALLIASAKATIVAMYFMHLKFEGLLIKLMVGAVMLVFLAFIVLTFFDYFFR
jgi:cytochrome c oxidase subunit 4